MNTPLVSIVSICWNRKADICESLRKIREIEYDNLEVILVDNYSTDGTIEEIEENFKEVKLIKMFKNIGIEAYNIGFKNANGKYIIIIDDDSFPHKQAVTRMVEKFENDKKLGIVAFDVRNFYNYDSVTMEELIEENKDTKAEAKDYLMAFNGAGAGVRRDLLEQVGFYPEEFFLYWNEQDTAFRILDAGYKIQFFSDVVSYHKRAPLYYTRNAFWLIWKNYSLGASIKLTFNMIKDCFYYSMEQKTLVYLKGMFLAFKDSKNLKGKRKPVDKYIEENLRIPFNVSFTFFK
jgi:hypothetical protein